MRKKTFFFTGNDNLEIFTYKWLPDNPPYTGVIQLAHGMAEHAKRYEYFAEFFTDNGYIVYANDHRGHGKTAGEIKNIGYLSDRNGWEKAVDDLYILTKHIKTDYPDIPLFLLGHSMGSLLCRTYIMNNSDEINGLILSGTSGKPDFIEKNGIILIMFEMLLHGKKGKSKLLWDMTFGKFNKPYKPARTLFDWLSRDNEEVNKYVNDEYCGGIFSPLFFKDLLHGVKIVNNKNNFINTNRALPIFLIDGDNDSVSKNGQGLFETYQLFRDLNFSNIDYKLYENARHCMLHEINKEQVFNDILIWIKKQ